MCKYIVVVNLYSISVNESLVGEYMTGSFAETKTSAKNVSTVKSTTSTCFQK